MNKDRKIVLVNTLSKGFSFPKDKTNSPLVIELPTEVESINLPSNILKMKIFIENSETEMYYASIYVGEVYRENDVRKICPNYLYSEWFDIKTLKDITQASNCVFYEDQNSNMILLAKLDENDLVVSSAKELQVLISEMSTNEHALKDTLTELPTNFAKIQDGVSRIRNLK